MVVNGGAVVVSFARLFSSLSVDGKVVASYVVVLEYSTLTVVSSGTDTGCVSLGDNCELVDNVVLDGMLLDEDLVVVDVMGSKERI